MDDGGYEPRESRGHPRKPYERRDCGGFDTAHRRETRSIPTVESVTKLHAQEVFRIRVSKAWHAAFDPLSPLKEHQPVAITDPSRMRDAGWCAPELIDALWHQKNRLDAIFDSGKSNLYYRARDTLFPLDRKGSERGLHNRAGDKLDEIHERVPILPKSPSSQRTFIFADVCGGPGAWSHFVMQNVPSSRGVGITLKLPDTPLSDLWYKDLLRTTHRWQPIWGPDGTGNVYVAANLDAVVEAIAALTGSTPNSEKSYKSVPIDQPTAVHDYPPAGAQLVAADGGFEIRKGEHGEHLENLQELFSNRIILSEVLLALRLLAVGDSEGGNTPQEGMANRSSGGEDTGVFVCKLFDCFSHLSVSLLFIVAHLFEEAFIVKPPRSRRANSERYLVAKGYCRTAEAREQRVAAIRLLNYLHQSTVFTDSTSPISAVPVDVMRSDEVFVESIREMLESICKVQTQTLKAIMDEVDVMVQRGGGEYRRGTKRRRDEDEREVERSAGRVFQRLRLPDGSMPGRKYFEQ